MKIDGRIIALGRSFTIAFVMSVSCLAGWELTKSWAGAWLAFAIVGYLLDIKIQGDDLKSKGK